MRKKHKFDSLWVEFFGNNTHLISMDGANDEYDCHDTCVIGNRMIFYGVPFDVFDDKMSSVYDGDYSNLIKIGEITGYLILCKQMLYEGENPWAICDDLNGDLEYTISALMDEGGPLSSEEGDPEQDIYYIHEFVIVPDYNDIKLKRKIINELPNLIFTFLHVNPELLAFYPAPLEYPPDENLEVRHRALDRIRSQKIETAFGSIINGDSKKKSNDNVVKFGDAYQFTEDELNMVMGRRHSESSYPEDAKDRKEYEFYKAVGFEEVGDSRLLYKYIGDDL